MERNINELLKLMLKNFQESDFHRGLCYCALGMNIDLIINDEEYYEIRKYIQDNRPTLYSSLQAFRNRNNSFYWHKGLKKPRIKWLNKHINLTSK